MKKPRVSIIGCGGMGRAHAKAILRFGGFELVAAADPAAEPREAMRKVAPSVRLYETTEEMLEKERPDLAVVATAAAAHRALVTAALRAGAHVLCEKPFAVSLAEADEMIDAARAAGRMLLVHHQFRINPRAQACLRLVREGRLGDVLAMRCAGKGRHGGWEMVETGTHLFDVAMLFGGAPRWASADLRVAGRAAVADDIVDSRAVGRLANGAVVGDRVYATIGFEGGAQLHGEFWEIPSTNFVNVVGTRGILHVPLGAAAADPYFCPKPFLNPNDPAATWERIPVEWGEWGQEHNIYTYDLWSKWLADPASGPMAIDGKHPLDAENGRLSLEMIHAAFESHFRGGARVPIPLESREHPLLLHQGRRLAPA